MTRSPDRARDPGSTDTAVDAGLEVPMPSASDALRRSFTLAYRAEPKLLVASLGSVVAAAVPDVAMAAFLAILTDAALDGDTTRAVIAGVAMAVAAVCTWLLKVVSERVERRFRDRVGIALEAHVAELHARVTTVEHHERSDYMDRLAMLRDQAFTLDHMFLSLFSTLGWVFRLIFTVILLATITPLLILLVAFAVPTVAMGTWRPTVERRVEESSAHSMRLARHLFTLGTTAPPGKEVRVDGIADELAAGRRTAAAQWLQPIARERWVTAVWTSLGWALFGVGYVLAVVYVAEGINGTVGQVTLVLVLGSRLSAYVGAAVGELGFLRGFWLDGSQRMCWLEDFAAAHERQADVPAPSALTDGITFDHVSFRYPGTDGLVLDDVELTLPAGSVVAVVGENGAGKTTLVKLLCKMYVPTKGAVRVDGVDLARISPIEWRGALAGAFQDFFRFELPAQASVGVGDEPRLDDRVAVTTAVHRAGATDVVDGLVHGLDTQLGPTWDAGVEVSFGQWQKLALARGFMRDHPLLVVLDEPTAALDAETEHALFARYAEQARSGAANGRITLLVSHRFSTVRMADLIVMLVGSKVAEVGTHEELMAAGGHYADLYNIQASAYR